MLVKIGQLKLDIEILQFHGIDPGGRYHPELVRSGSRDAIGLTIVFMSPRPNLVGIVGVDC